MKLDNNILRRLLENVYFLNGTAYAGKSTMVRLLAQKHGGIECGENYHMDLLHLADPVHQPNLCYMQTMSSWQEFIGRTPEEYDAWLQGCSREAAQLELIQLIRLSQQGKKIFVDTNIPVEVLQEISDYHRVAVMLSPQSMSVERFFQREDPEKQFLLNQIRAAEDPEHAMENYRACLALANSPEHYHEFADSGFFTHVRTEESTLEATLRSLEDHFKLHEKG